MYQALYRKWRPRRFDDVVGQGHITGTLKKQVETGRLSHAYLFVGTRGTGKTSCAKILARAVNCERPVNGNPCNECPSCRGIESGGIMDVVELDAASNNGVDSVRALRDEAIFSPASVKKRVYIIDEVHMLSASAFNALLKILEEPPEHLLFILCTTELRKVLPTIVSRCQRHSFKRLSAADIAGRLRYVAAQENMKLSDEAAELLGRLADGGMRDGLSLLDQCSSAEEITAESVLSSMGLAGSRRTAELLEAVFAHNTEQALALFDALWKAGKDPAAILDELGSLMRDVLLCQVAPKGGENLISGAWGMETLRRFAKSISGAELLNALSAVDAAATAGSSPRRAAELCLVSLCVPEVGESLPALRARVAKLERLVAQGVPAAPAAKPTYEAPAAPAAAPKPEAPPKAEEKPRPPASPSVAFEPLPDEDEPPFYDDADAPPLPEEESVFRPAAPTIEPEPTPEPIPKPERIEAPVQTPVSGGAQDDFAQKLLERLQGKLETYIHMLLLPSAETRLVLAGEVLTIHAGSPFALTMLEQSDVRVTIQQQASELLGHAVTVKVTDQAAPAAAPAPAPDKLDKLSQFSNVKFE